MQVTLSSNPAFLKSKLWTLDRIAPAGIRPITDRDIELDGTFLLELADSLSGHTKITVEQNGAIIADQTTPVELLAYNEWGGAGYMPELLAAFSMPNDSAVDRILHDASLILRQAGKPDGGHGKDTLAAVLVILNPSASHCTPPANSPEPSAGRPATQSTQRKKP